FRCNVCLSCCIFFFQAEDGIRDRNVTGVQTCALPISLQPGGHHGGFGGASRVASCCFERQIIKELTNICSEQYYREEQKQENELGRHLNRGTKYSGPGG